MNVNMQVDLTERALEVLQDGQPAHPVSFPAAPNVPLPMPADRIKISLPSGEFIFVVIGREFEYLPGSTTVRLLIDVPAEQ